MSAPHPGPRPRCGSGPGGRGQGRVRGVGGSGLGRLGNRLRRGIRLGARPVVRSGGLPRKVGRGSGLRELGRGGSTVALGGRLVGRRTPRAPVVAPGLVVAGHGVDSARSPMRPMTMMRVTCAWVKDTGATGARVGAAAGETTGVVAVARPVRTPPGTGATVRLHAAAADRPAAAAAITVARSALRWQGGARGGQQPQGVVARRDRTRAQVGRECRAEGQEARTQVTGHRRPTGERAAKATLLRDVVGAGLAGDEVTVPRPLPVQRQPAGGVLRQLVPLALHPHRVGHTVPAAGRRMIRPRALVGVVVEGCGARCASDSRSWARPRWMRERTVPSLMPSVAATSS